MKVRPAPYTLFALVFLEAVVAIGLATGPGAVASGATVPSCTPVQMRVTHGAPQGSAGTTYIRLTFTNVASACAIWGVPSVQPVLTSRRALGPAARNQSMGEMPMRHVLTKDQSVSVAFGVVQTSNYPAAACVARTAGGVVVALGDFVRPTFLRLPISVCTKLASTTTRLIVAGAIHY